MVSAGPTRRHRRRQRPRRRRRVIGAAVEALAGPEVAPLRRDEAVAFAWTAQGLDWRFDVRFAVDAAKNVIAVERRHTHHHRERPPTTTPYDHDVINCAL